MKTEKIERQSFNFRADVSNYDYLCGLARQERYCSLNLCLNLLLSLLQEHEVESLDHLESILSRQNERQTG